LSLTFDKYKTKSKKKYIPFAGGFLGTLLSFGFAGGAGFFSKFEIIYKIYFSL